MTEHTTMRWKIPAWAWFPVSLAIGAESISNGLRAYKLGSHLEGLNVNVFDVTVSLAGGVLVLAAVAISICQARAAFVALTPGDTSQRVIAGSFAVLFLTISVTALHSYISEAERAKVGDEQTEKGKYKIAKQAYERASADYEKVKDADTPESVQAMMDAIPIDPKLRLRTKNCTDVTTRVSQRECAPVVKHNPELAAARRKAELEAKLPGLKADLDKLKDPELASDSDQSVSSFWGWLVGLGIVGIATFGAVIFAKVEPETKVETGKPAETFRESYADPVRPSPNGGNRRRHAFTKQAAEADVIRLFRENGSIPSQETLSERWQVGKGTVSKWMGDFERRGLISRETVGRCKTVVPFKKTA